MADGWSWYGLPVTASIVIHSNSSWQALQQQVLFGPYPPTLTKLVSNRPPQIGQWIFCIVRDIGHLSLAYDLDGPLVEVYAPNLAH